MVSDAWWPELMPQAEVRSTLESVPSQRFSDWRNSTVLKVAAGVYTIWQERCSLADVSGRYARPEQPCLSSERCRVSFAKLFFFDGETLYVFRTPPEIKRLSHQPGYNYYFMTYPGDEDKASHRSNADILANITTLVAIQTNGQLDQ